MSSINCTEFNDRLLEAVESHKPVDAPALRDHAVQCASCRAAWLDAVLVDGAVAQWRKTKRTVPPADLADVVLFRNAALQEAAASPQAKGPGRLCRRLSRAAAVAAAVVAATLVVGVLSGRLGKRQMGSEMAQLPVGPLLQQASPMKIAAAVPLATAVPLAVTPSPKIVPTPPIQTPRAQQAAPARASAPVEAMVQDAESAYIDLASEAAQAIASATVLVPQPGTPSAAAPPPGEKDHFVDDVGRQFEPVSKNLTQAFQFLLEAVPADKAPAT